MTLPEQRDHLDRTMHLLNEVQRALAAWHCAQDFRGELSPAVGGELWRAMQLIDVVRHRLPGIVAHLEAASAQ